jgi:hypothetical protein
MDGGAAVLFMIACLFLPMLFSCLISNQVKASYQQPVEVVKYVYIEKEKPVKIKIEKPKVELPQQDQQIKNEALESLISLGLKKAIANKKVNDLFSKKIYTTVEDFLIDAYKI